MLTRKKPEESSPDLQYSVNAVHLRCSSHCLRNRTIFSTIEHSTWCPSIKNVTLPDADDFSMVPPAFSTA